ncbi:hypothetical protein GGI35DRAFT_301131 [Trichoderma velutinum]
MAAIGTTTRKALRPTSREDFEIAIVCAKGLEYNAVCLLVDGFWDEDGDSFGRAIGDPNTYTTGYMGGFNVVVVLLCNSGKVAAASTTASLRSSYPCVKLLLLTGLCDGVPNAMDKELLLGDVVISDTVVQYDLGRRYPNGFRESNTLEDRLGRPNKNVRNLVTIFKTELGLQRLEKKLSCYLRMIQQRVSKERYRQSCRATYQYPGSTNDILFKSTYCHKHYHSPQCICDDHNEAGDPVCGKSRKTFCEQTGCDKDYLLPRSRLQYKKNLEDNGNVEAAQQPSVFVGRFGSGDTNFNSAIDRDLIAQKHNIIAFETEGAGAWDELSCIIIKGVSTYGDGHIVCDLEAWENFAAPTAASAARGLIDYYPQTDKLPSVESKNQTDIAFKNQADIACLRDLYITSPPNDRIRIEQTRGGLLLDVYAWILKNDAYKQWCEDPQTCLLWIRGDPGKGKTMLLCGIIDHLQELIPSDNLYYFFYQATDSRLNNASSALRGLLHMLISKQPHLIPYVRYEYDKSGKSIFEDSNSWIILSRIFSKILKDPSIRNMTFIIDALDECLIGLTDFLELIQQSSSTSGVKWLVSSRNEITVQDVLLSTENNSVISLELNSESVSAAIRTYIHHKVEFLSKEKRYQQDMRDSIEEYLIKNADGTFLWVALVCEMLKKAPSFDLRPKSAAYPSGLDNIYSRMMEKVLDSEFHWGSRILAVSTVARRPLSIQELETLTFSTSTSNDTFESLEKRWEEALGYCGNFLTKRKGIVYFVHQSAKDFIINKASDRLFSNGMEYINKHIFKVSISTMTNTLRKDIYGLMKPGFLIDHLTSLDVPNPDPLTPVGYCCVYWIDHFVESVSPSDNDNNEELIYKFLKEKYLYWLEALSLLRSMYHGEMRMQKLEKLLADTKWPGLKNQVWDARRFIQMFGKAIGDAPLQVYVSALLFSPTESIIRKQFNAEASHWVRLWPRNVTNWTSCVQRLDGDPKIPYRFLSVSSCHTWLAAREDENQMIRIWEIETGRKLCTIEFPTTLTSYGWFKFSLWVNNELIVFNSCQRSLTIWDITSSTIVRQIRVPHKKIHAISLSPSAPNFLGMIFRDYGKTINFALWNTQKDEKIKTISLLLEKHVEVVSFSPVNNDILAMYTRTPNGHQVIIYDIDTHNVIRTFEFGWIRYAAFSSNGKYLASFPKPTFEHCMPKCTLLDTMTGETVLEIELQSFPYGDPAFSNNGQMLAVSTRNLVQIWDLVSRQCLQRTKMTAYCPTFSPNGTNQLFCGSMGSIAIVEVDQQEMAPLDLDLYDSIEKEISISPNGKMVATWRSATLSLWDTDSGASRIGISTGETSFFKTQFSPDSTMIALMSDYSVAVWDISSESAKFIYSRSMLVSLADHSFRVISFSPNSRLLAMMDNPSSSRNRNIRRIRILDITSKSILVDFRSRPVINAILTFSSDSTRLAVALTFEDEGVRKINVKVWNIASGSATNVIVLCDTYFGDIIKAQIGSFKHLNTKEPPYFDLETIKFSDSNHLILGSKRTVDDGSSPLLMTRKDGETYRNFNIKVVLTLNRELSLKTKQEVNNLRTQDKPSYGIDPSGSWITLDAERLVWLPPEYRLVGVNCNWDARHSCVAMSNESKPLFILKFCCSTCPRQITPKNGAITECTSTAPERHKYTYACSLDDDFEILSFDMDSLDNDMIESRID